MLRAEVDVCGNGGQVGLLAVVVVEKLYRGGDAGELDLLGGGHRIFSLFWIKGKTLLQFARQYFRQPETLKQTCLLWIGCGWVFRLPEHIVCNQVKKILRDYKMPVAQQAGVLFPFAMLAGDV